MHVPRKFFYFDLFQACYFHIERTRWAVSAAIITVLLLWVWGGNASSVSSIEQSNEAIKRALSRSLANADALRVKMESMEKKTGNGQLQSSESSEKLSLKSMKEINMRLIDELSEAEDEIAILRSSNAKKMVRPFHLNDTTELQTSTDELQATENQDVFQATTKKIEFLTKRTLDLEDEVADLKDREVAAISLREKNWEDLNLTMAGKISLEDKLNVLQNRFEEINAELGSKMRAIAVLEGKHKNASERIKALLQTQSELHSNFSELEVLQRETADELSSAKTELSLPNVESDRAKNGVLEKTVQLEGSEVFDKIPQPQASFTSIPITLDKETHKVHKIFQKNKN